MKKLDKKLQKLIDGDELTEESALLAGALTLMAAQEIAHYNKDIDALVAISERWLAMSRLLSEESSDKYANIGFAIEQAAKEMMEESGEYGEGNNEGKSRTKVRKKSR